MFKIKPIKNELDYQKAQELLNKLDHSAKDSKDHDLKEVLKVLINSFEKENYPFEQANFDQWIDFMQKNNNSEKKLKEIKETEKEGDYNDLSGNFEKTRVKVIRQRLKEKNLKQKDLVNIIGVDKSYVSQLMSGKKNFTVPIISKLYHYLDIPYEVLIPPASSFSHYDED
jgi:HTH-type transcriptional regulator/antitoxin HigA